MTPLDGSLLSAATWVVTYLVHSTLVLGGVALALACLRAGARVRDVAWKCALCLPFATASAHVVWPERALAPRYTVTVPALAPASASPATPGRASALADAPAQHKRRASAAAEVSATPAFEQASREARQDLVSGDPRPRPARPSLSARPAWTVRSWLSAFGAQLRAVPRETWQSLAVLAAALATCVVLLVPRLRLVWLLRLREPVTGGVLAEELAGLAERAGLGRVRLSVSNELRSPIALGTLRPEIVVPRRALTELARPMARALVAHELAHHARRDPLWLSLAHTACTLFALQPLNRLARRELVATAELLADDLALEWTEDGVGLARCLTEVAGWALAGERGVAALTMVRANDVGGLRRRVERALERPRERSSLHLAVGAVVIGGVVALAAPGLALVERAAGAPKPSTLAPKASTPSPSASASARTRAAATESLAALEVELDTTRADLARVAERGSPAFAAAAATLAARAESLTAAVAALRAELMATAPEPTSALAGVHDDLPFSGGTKSR